MSILETKNYSVLKDGVYDVKLLNFIVDAEPENYVRERVVRGGQAYNPKTDIMKEYTNYLLHQMSKEDYEYTRKLLSDESKTYYVKISVRYHLPIPKNDSAYKTVLKATGAVMHDKTPDLDNYDKFIIDCLHTIINIDVPPIISGITLISNCHVISKK